jgi:glycosyltransferase involved in cell wall biosynthesis
VPRDARCEVIAIFHIRNKDRKEKADLQTQSPRCRGGFASSFAKIRYCVQVDWPKTTAAIIPCLNEARTLPLLVQQVRRFLPTVIVVDDGSQDSTTTAASASGARVVRHEQNEGKGAAINSGLTAAFENGFEFGLLLDGDGQHSPQNIPALLECTKTTGADLVVGNRMENAHAMSWMRRRVNRWMSRRLSRLTGKNMPDSQCGFRVVRLAAWRRMEFCTRNFEVESEMVLNFARGGYQIEFVPIAVVSGIRRSHIRPVRDTWRWFKWWRVVSRSSTCAPVSHLHQKHSPVVG